ncbi:NUDIX domain-containing protein [Streptomyces sp. NPDC001744]|uniref:NUDIX domain-containing protein n=1 Tax=Streptomyces sp. NPDC001744 TaxID=3364606 RepID=UPI003694BE43
MPDRRSAGLLVFRRTADRGVEVLIGHMGGPLWRSREEGAWSIPKGEYGPGEAPGAAAGREFREELGLPAPEGEWIFLGENRQRSGKLVTVWAVEGEADPDRIVPGTFTMEWPPRSGRRADFPEIDRAGWFTPGAAAPLLVAGQRVFLERLEARLAERDRARLSDP